MSKKIDWERVACAVLHPAQRAILEHLAEHGKASPVQLTRAMGVDLSLGDYAYHTRKLEERGLVREVDTRQRRGATEHFFSLAS